MCPNGKARPPKQHKQTRNWVIGGAALLLIIILISVALLNTPKTPVPSSQQDESAGFKAFTAQYLAIMQNLNSSQTKAKMASLLNPSWNQTDLFAWEASKLTFNDSLNGFFYDPFQILNDDTGICMQWSIVYVSACLALGYQSRLVVAVDTSSWTFIHTWAEDYYNGSWVHVDPSDKVWNDPSRYQSWDWGSQIGSGVRIYAFEDGTYQDVTDTYSAH